MPVCPRCRSEYASGAHRCEACRAPLLDVVAGRGPQSRIPLPASPVATRSAVLDEEDEAPPVEDRLVLLLEEPLPEMAAMIREFLHNCGIGSVVHNESIGLLYRLPLPGAPISGSKVYVRESDFQEARELVAHFFRHA